MVGVLLEAGSSVVLGDVEDGKRMPGGCERRGRMSVK